MGVLTNSNAKTSFLNPGERHIWTNLPVPTAIYSPSGLNWRAFTVSLKVMRWRTTRRGTLMNWQRRFSSTVRRKVPSGEAAMRRMLEEDWVGRVMVWDLRRSVMETRLPTGEISWSVANRDLKSQLFQGSQRL
ncbi:hypothetical protein Tsubulata_031569 [Turnera subulata]|uniref:Uncharacterized protein n=1 Tax=Turnera subulata TaxID=218843 RepID=A0A9Q0F4P2_9ROSI|nr:hypothetical protein Tsubulata_045991 [Turnera subulata]KAJ4849895.1 hypothetical protein Tsubulata_031569 [Turnera subulata]